MTLAPLHARARPFQGVLAAVFKLIDSQDPDNLSQALELMVQSAEPFDALFEQCGIDGRGGLIRSQRLYGSAATQPVFDALLLHQLSIAPEGSRGALIRCSLRSLSLALAQAVPAHGFDALESLDIKLAPACSLADLQWLDALPALQALSIVEDRAHFFSVPAVVTAGSQPPGLSALTGLQAPRLASLHLGSRTLSDLTGLAACTALTRLKLSDCPALESLAPLAALSSLQELTMAQCDQVADLSPLAGLKQLRVLEIRNNEGIASLAPAGALAALERLELSCVLGLSDVDLPATMPALKEVVIDGDGPLALSGLRGAPSLTSVSLSRCRVVSLEPLSACSALTTLRAFDCMQLQDLEPLQALAFLQTLELDLRGDGVRELTPLSALTRLTSLTLYGELAQTVSYAPLGLLGELRTLSLHGAPGMTEVGFVAALAKLEKLELRSCKALVDLSGLAAHASLQEVSIDWCEAVRDVTALSTLPALKRVGMFGVSRPKGLKRLQALAGLKLDK